MFSKFINFITSIRNADESRRKLWFGILSGGASVVVILLWLIFFNLNLPAVDGYAVTNSQIADEPSGIMAKLAEIKTTLGRGVAAVGDKLGFKNRFVIEASDRNFVLKGLEPVPVSKLPE